MAATQARREVNVAEEAAMPSQAATTGEVAMAVGKLYFCRGRFVTWGVTMLVERQLLLLAKLLRCGCCMRSRWAPIAACWWITARAMCCSSFPSRYLYGLRKSNT